MMPGFHPPKKQYANKVITVKISRGCEHRQNDGESVRESEWFWKWVNHGVGDCVMVNVVGLSVSVE